MATPTRWTCTRGGRDFAIDTGFIVFNERTYPNFVAMLRELGVHWQDSNMSFSLRCERSGLEYNGTSLNSLFAQRRNLLRPSFLRMIAEILRFNSRAPELLQTDDDTLTLADYLRRGRYSREFVEHYIVPMGRAIWSAEATAMLSFPARFFVDFFDRHGFLSVDDRPQWLTVRGGSREYVRAMLSGFRGELRLGTAVRSIRRHAGGVHLRTEAGEANGFDYAFLACHADQALSDARAADTGRARGAVGLSLRAERGDPAHRRVAAAEAPGVRGRPGTTTCSPTRRSRLR